MRRFLATSIAAVLAVTLAPSAALAGFDRSVYIIEAKPGFEDLVIGQISQSADGETELSNIGGLIIASMLSVDADNLRASGTVLSVELDAPVALTETQSPTPSWGLDRIDGSLNNSYSYPDSAGQGLTAYVFDTGVAGDHPELIGRVTAGFDAVDGSGANLDCHSHGTHVAGTIAGTNFGIAKSATVVPLRVLGCSGSGSYSGVIRAIDWAISHHQPGQPAVANLSLGGTRSSAMNTAIAALVADGVTTVVAAGNSYTDACNSSPASAPEAITVGATDRYDNKASFSNYGNCVDIFAPGVGIPSANSKNYAAPVSYSGTSMASPHVAGIVGLIASMNPLAELPQIEQRLYDISLPGIVGNSNTVRGNRLAQVPAVDAAPIPVQSQGPQNLRVTEVGPGWVSFGWDSVAGASGYQVEYRAASSTTSTVADVAATSFTVSNLFGSEVASLRVRAQTPDGATNYSAYVSGKAAMTVPTAPRSPVIQPTSKTSMIMSWFSPASLGGANTVLYRVEMDSGNGWSPIQTSAVQQVNISAMNTPHRFRVFAVNQIGDSPATEVVTFDPGKIFTVSNLGLTATGTTISATWQSDVPAATFFEVQLIKVLGGSVVRTVQTTNNQVSLTGLTRQTAYRVAVTPLGEIRGITAQQLITTPASVASAPKSLGSIRNLEGYLLRFSASTDNGGSNITGYRLERLDGTAWVEVATSMALEHQVAAPERGQTVSYRLVALNSEGASLPSNTITLTTPGAAPTPVTGLTGSVQTDGRVTLSWLAPADNGGSPVTAYRIEMLRSGTWGYAGQSTTTSVTLPILNKGTSGIYRVTALNRFGPSVASEQVLVERQASEPGSVISLSANAMADGVKLTWRAPSDNGGSSILGYQIQRKVGASWENELEVDASALEALVDLQAPGTLHTYRVLAINAVGASLSGTERAVAMPYLAPSAPKDLVATLTNGRVSVSWSAPESLGGSSFSYYRVEVRIGDGGFSYLTTTRSSSVIVNPSRKGSEVRYRVAAVSAHGKVGSYSESEALQIPTTIPGDVTIASAKLQTDGVLLSWSAPVDDGGSALTGYRIQLRQGNSWIDIAESADSSYLAPLGKAGEVLQHRVLATNEAGTSLNGRVVQTTMGVAPATAPRELKSELSNSRLVISWVAPEIMGGRFYNYTVETSVGTAPFTKAATTSSNQWSLSTPAPGQTVRVRVFANTVAGIGALSEVLTYEVPKVAPSAPSSFSLSSSRDQVTVRWSLSGARDGGSPITSAVLYRVGAGEFVEVAKAPVADLTASFGNNLPGTYQQYVMRFVNEIGESVNSRIYTLRHAFLPTSLPKDLSSQLVGNQVTLSWNNPAQDGGSAPRYVEVQRSSDGATWTRYTTQTWRNSLSVPAAIKGSTIHYRILVHNSGGVSLPSESVSIETPRSVVSSDFRVDAYRVGSNLRFRLYSPSDLGGYTTATVLIERTGVLAFQSGTEYLIDRARSYYYFDVPLSEKGTLSYRFSIVNPSGEVDRSVSFRYY